MKKHQDFANKYCPHRTLDLGWDRFVDMVKQYLSTSIQKPDSPISKSNYYPQYDGSSNSLVDALNSLNIPSSFEARKKIATNNGMIDYSGSSDQNTQLLQLLKQGKLKK